MSQPVATVSEIKRAEQAWALANHGHTYPLMEQAAASFVRQFESRLTKSAVRVVVGRGNNGGDGYLIARHLLSKQHNVKVVAPLGPPKAGADAALAAKAYLDSGGEVLESVPEDFSGCWVDALMGSGFIGALADEVSDILQTINRSPGEVLSVDVPSGLNADTGAVSRPVICADATHSFIAFKPGTLTGEGPAHCGSLSLDTLGVSVNALGHYQPNVESLPARAGNTYKGQHGHLSVLAGWGGMTGAALIAGEAALRSGAGRVTLHLPESAHTACWQRCPELITQSPTAFAPDQGLVLAGPGLGFSDLATTTLQRVLESTVYGVLDADALRWLANNPVTVPGWVLTPHEGEAASLLGVSSADVRADRVAAVQALAQQTQACVVLKGAGTLVAQGECLTFCHSGHPAMSTPGMGDALAGIIAGLIAQGLSAFEAAITGANWHARLGYQRAQSQRLVLASEVVADLSLKL